MYGRKIIERCRAVVDVSEKNLDIAVVGKRGDGKSYIACELAYTLDPTFTAERVVYSIEEFLKLVKVLPPGSAVVADEIGEWYSSRNFMKDENKDLSAILQIFRINRLIVIYTLPMMYQVDKNLRSMSDVYIRACRVHRGKKLTEGKWYDIEMHPIRGKKPYTIHPVIRGPDGYKKKITRVFFDKMPDDMEARYAEKKEEFNARVIDAKMSREKKEDKEEKEPNAKCENCGYRWRTIAMKPRCGKCDSSRVVVVKDSTNV